MKEKLIYISVFILFIACNRSKNDKNELNNISFNIDNKTMMDSLQVATDLLNKMDYGNGVTCFVVNGKLHHTRKDPGFSVIELPDINSANHPVIEPLDEITSIRFFKLIQFFITNDINSFGKRYDGEFCFGYKQHKFNSFNDSKKIRTIVYLQESQDTCSRFFKDYIILDRYKNIVLLAPENYNKPKLPMDREHIMKRTEESMKKGK